MPLFSSLAKNTDKSRNKAPVSSGGAGYAWRPSDDKSQQRQKGNQSMLRNIHKQHGLTMIPTRKQLEQVLGEAKGASFFGLKENSTTYRPVLDSLDQLNYFLDTTELAPDPEGMEEQLNRALALMDNLEQAVNHYIAKKNNKKAKYMKDLLLPLIRNVRVGMTARINKYKLNPPMLSPKWYLIANGDLTRAPRTMKDSMKSRGSASGAINTVDFYKVNYSEEFVFKQTKDVLEEDTTEYDVAHYDARIDTKNARFANRNVALYRLDKLLGGDLIPKTEFAMRVANDGKRKVLQEGTIMRVAAGESAADIGESGRFVHHESDKAGKAYLKTDGSQQKPIAITDPNLQRLLSRLQLLDALAFQVDRHTGNFFIEFDENGNVVGVKGIDNDMTFGTEKELRPVNRFPGVSKFVDKEMAERILALRNEDLQAALGDLLTPEEMQALFTRLDKLKQRLASAELLEPDQWNDATAMMLAKEGAQSKFNDTSYFGKLYRIFLDENKIKLDD